MGEVIDVTVANCSITYSLFNSSTLVTLFDPFISPSMQQVVISNFFKQASMFGQFKATCFLFMLCLLVTLQETQQEKGGAKCKKKGNKLPWVRKNLL